MSGDLQTGFLLLGVGMVTVFVVLGIVTLIGKLLIALFSGLAPAAMAAPASSSGSGNIPGPQIAAITAAITAITRGRGHIEKVERRNK